MTTGKLVRDGIPQIIRDKGQAPIITVADETEYRLRLREKLGEEALEYLNASSDGEAIEELADVLEVVRALAVLHGADAGQLEKVRAAKAEARGGFEQRIVWYGNEAA